MVPSLRKVLQKRLVLFIPFSSLLRVKVFAKDGSLAGHVVLVGRVEDGIEKSLEQAQSCSSQLRQDTRAKAVPTTSEVTLGALVEEQSVLQVARSRDFLGTAIWARRVAFVVIFGSLALGIAAQMRAFAVGLESRPLTHFSCYVAFKTTDFESCRQSRISAGMLLARRRGHLTANLSPQSSLHPSSLSVTPFFTHLTRSVMYHLHLVLFLTCSLSM